MSQPRGHSRVLRGHFAPKAAVQAVFLICEVLTAMVLCPQAPAVSALIGLVGMAYTVTYRDASGRRRLNVVDWIFLSLMGALAGLQLVEVVPRAVGYWQRILTGHA